MNRHSATPVKISDSVAPPTAEEERKIDVYWRAANYLSVGQIYLYDNPLLREPLGIEHIKPRPSGHWAQRPDSISSMFT